MIGSSAAGRAAVCAAVPIASAVDSTAVRIDLGELGPGDAQLQLTARDARDVEKVVDQADQLFQLPVDDRAGALAPLGVELRHGHELDGVAHGGERIAQLVGERGEEHVLAVRSPRAALLRPGADR